MLWRTVRSMDVMMHSSSFLLPKLHRPANKSVKNYALVVLNQHLPRYMPRLWDHANLRICADGGANRIFYEMFQLTNDEDEKSTRNRYIPEIIEGDMDSIRPEGSKISDKSHNQETTDLHKCISRIHHSTPEHEKHNLCVLVTGALGGRFDHEAANINVLYLFSDMRIVLLSDDCLIRLLPKTHHHELYIESSIEGPHCGLFPVGAPSTNTTTTGLKWNLSESKMRFGSMISTSNIVQSEKSLLKSIELDRDSQLSLLPTSRSKYIVSKNACKKFANVIDNNGYLFSIWFPHDELPMEEFQIQTFMKKANVSLLPRLPCNRIL
ncbi:hypothetical protein C2845_PM08G12890 [Panicum miliaceum]|uniref:thiamine diphosphokinase n=1 Tax=Panicum miliaceum TaxID=4540 RepID=A0A3L6QXH3_PANMI|nr:hypothetical protein C2845_PM08G12890 [Panicum miliaceum]